ncbi:MAG: LPS export ABC transporter permease LptF [Pseudomonadota bacterium]
MNSIPRYIVLQCLGPLLFALGVLTAIVWLTQSLQRIDIIVERGQTAAVFLMITLLILPSLLAVITPFALFAAVLYALHRMHADSELVVMFAAGMSRLRLAAPLLLLGVGGMVVTLFLNLWMMPAGYRAMKERVADIRADLATSLLRGGEFTSPTDDLTFYASQSLPGGQFQGLLVYDRRKEERPVAYLAESGLFRETLNGPQLLMAAGSIQRMEPETGEVSFLHFDQYALDMSQFAKPSGEFQLELTERFLSELLHPDPDYRWDRDNAGRLVAEGHNRLAASLYNLAYVLVALTAMTGLHYARRGLGMRVLGAVTVVLVLRVFGFLAQSAAADAPAWNTAQYAVPLCAILACLIALSDVRHRIGFGPARAPTAAPA